MTGPSGSLAVVELCPLAWPEQPRKVIVFAAGSGIQYLAAPVLYVGITQPLSPDHGVCWPSPFTVRED